MWKGSHIVGHKLFSLLFDLKGNMTVSKAFCAIIAIALSLSMSFRASKELCDILLFSNISCDPAPMFIINFVAVESLRLWW